MTVNKSRSRETSARRTIKRSTLPIPGGRAPRSDCPVGWALEVIGDRWTLLIIRDMLVEGKKTYKEFQDSPERIPTNTLAARLKLLEETGIVEKNLYQTNPDRYEYTLTKRGLGLRDVLISLRDWAQGLKT
ncbi:MAG: helix-turn-helix domain-containing protein [Pseudomonadota bacterium]